MSVHSDTAAALAFLNVLFGECEGPINLCTLRNNAGGAGPQITSGDAEALKQFIIKHDARGWGTYVCVSTMVNKERHHAKESISEIPSLHIDIDLKDLALDNKEDVLKKLKALRLPPSMLVDSGNGIHAYWKFKEAHYAEDIDRIEDALKLLCDLVGGDMKVTQPSAVMRLPGTFNTKYEGQNHLVTLWVNDANGAAEMSTYELDDIEEWLSETSPVILRKERPEGKTVKQADDDGSRAARYERLLDKSGYKPPLDYEKRIERMMYMGIGEDSIHETQVQVSASLLEAGIEVEDIVTLLMDATRAAAGGYGKNWNWTRGKQSEENRIRQMCETWIKKQEKRDDKIKTDKADKPKTNGKGNHQQQGGASPQSTASPASVKDKIKDKKEPFFITVAKNFFIDLEDMGHDLRIFIDSKGNENLWKYEEGLWSIVMNIDAWLDGHIEEIIQDGLKSNNKSSNRVCSEARKYILRSPNVRRMQQNPFDQHGKIPVKGMLIDPLTLKVEPIKKEHYCTWTLDIIYDPKAKCPWWLRMLNDTFSDRTPEDRKERIDLLQDFMGAGLVDNKNKALRRAMVIIGESNSGKSSLLDVMSGMMTNDPITTPIIDLTSNHGMQSFVRRAPWILHEAFDQSEWNISSKAKLILGGDVFEVNPKGKNAVSTSFTAPAIWSTNHEPKFKESTKAMINRMILLRTTFIFEEEIGAAAEARKHGEQEPQAFVLKAEKSGILNWMLVGAQRAMSNGKYIDTAEGKEALHDIRIDSNIVAGFVEDCLNFNPDIRISTPDFNAAFTSWWKEHRGDDRHVPSPDFIGRSLKALSHAQIALDRHKFRDRDGLRFFCGVELNEAGRAHWENTADVVNGAGNQAKGDLARISSTVSGVRSPIPVSWDDHPQIIRIRANATRQKTKPKF